MAAAMSDITDDTERGPGPAEGNGTPEGERIAKAIARAGLASRRDAEAMIEAGRVTLNEQVLTSPAVNVTEADRITVDGEPLPARERTRLWILHKPRGVVTTARDPEGRQTVFDVLPDDLPRVVAIGRLDINTEGLLLLTNDGGLAKVIAHPETGWLRRYRVRAFGDVTQADLDRLRGGVTIEDMEYGPVEATLDRAQGDNVWLTLGLREGKNREVKRILEHLGLSVNRLIRLSFGPFQLGDLEVGLVEEVRTKVLKEQLGKSLAEQAGVDFESPVREPIAPFGNPKKAARDTGRQGAPQRGASPERGPRRERPPARGGFERPPRDPARPPAPKRAPTGGMGGIMASGPRRSTWHAEDGQGDAPRGTRIPRRGGDPKAARAAAAERSRERVGAIQTGERRVVVERLQASPETPAPEPHRRVRFRKHEDEAPRPPRRERLDDRAGERRGPPRERSAGDRPPRRDDRPRGGFDRSARERSEERRGPPRERLAGDRPPRREGRPGNGFDRGAGERPGRPEGNRRERPAFRGEGPPRGERPSGGPRGGKPAGGRGFKPGGGRPGGGFKGGKPGPRGPRPPRADR